MRCLVRVVLTVVVVPLAVYFGCFLQSATDAGALVNGRESSLHLSVRLVKSVDAARGSSHDNKPRALGGLVEKWRVGHGGSVCFWKSS
jgi:hypothetical protein